MKKPTKTQEKKYLSFVIGQTKKKWQGRGFLIRRPTESDNLSKPNEKRPVGGYTCGAFART